MQIGVLGAGAIGGYLGLCLSAAEGAVTLVGRRSLVEQRERLHAVTLEGREHRPGEPLVVTEDPSVLSDMDVVLVTVKSQATTEAAQTIAKHAKPGATVVSFQNGLGNAVTLRETLGDRVVAGMVAFNVFREDEGARFRQATRGALVAGLGTGPHVQTMKSLAASFAPLGPALSLREDIDDVLAGKLLLNLNNGICAVTGLPIAQSLMSPDARWCLSRCMLEGLAAVRAAGYKPRSVLGLPPWIIARLVRLPNAILLRIAKRMVSADPSARSSTLQDLDAGKPTEIDELNGAIVALSRSHQLPCPANSTVVEIVRQLEASTPPLPFVEPAQLRARIAARS
ncbi:MAG: 2-dehydropantoate 2-reductase [Myxococcota bacterium]